MTFMRKLRQRSSFLASLIAIFALVVPIGFAEAMSCESLFTIQPGSSQKFANFSEGRKLIEYLTLQPGPHFIHLTIESANLGLMEIAGLVKPVAINEYKFLEITENDGTIHLVDPYQLDWQDDFLAKTSDRPLKDRVVKNVKIKNLIAPDFVNEMKFLKKIRESPDPYSESWFYENLALGHRAENLVRHWYPKHSSEMIDLVRGKLGEEFTVLLVDPGIVFRLHQFVEFASSLRPHGRISPVELRTEFSKDLGQTIVYRAMLLTHSELQQIKKNGILAPSFLRSDSLNLTRSMFDPFARLSTGMHVEARRRLSGMGNRSLSQILSVSDHEDVAASVAFHSQHADKQQETRLIVFKIELPILSTFRPEGFLSLDSQGPFRSGAEFAVGDHRMSADDPGIERFIPFRVDRSLIKGARRYQDIPPNYEFPPMPNR